MRRCVLMVTAPMLLILLVLMAPAWFVLLRGTWWTVDIVLMVRLRWNLELFDRCMRARVIRTMTLALLLDLILCRRSAVLWTAVLKYNGRLNLVRLGRMVLLYLKCCLKLWLLICPTLTREMTMLFAEFISRLVCLIRLFRWVRALWKDLTVLILVCLLVALVMRPRDVALCTRLCLMRGMVSPICVL